MYYINIYIYMYIYIYTYIYIYSFFALLIYDTIYVHQVFIQFD